MTPPCPICPNCNKPIIGNLSPDGMKLLPDAFCHCIAFVTPVAWRLGADGKPVITEPPTEPPTTQEDTKSC